MGVAHPVRSPLDRASPIHHAERSQGYSPLNEYQGRSPRRKSEYGNRNAGRISYAGHRTVGVWCGRRDLNPHGPCGPTDFHTQLWLSPPLLSCLRVWGLDYPFTVPGFSSGARCCPSSLYKFPALFGPGLARDRHVTGFPEFEQFCAAGFPTGTQVLSLKSDASADSATPAQFQT